MQMQYRQPDTESGDVSPTGCFRAAEKKKKKKQKKQRIPG